MDIENQASNNCIQEMFISIEIDIISFIIRKSNVLAGIVSASFTAVGRKIVLYTDCSLKEHCRSV